MGHISYLKEAFHTAGAFIARESHAFNHFLYDHHFLDIHPHQTAHDLTHKAADLFTKGKRKLQDSVHRTLSEKNASGDFVTKPTAKVALALAQECAYLAGEILPHATRLVSSPALATLTCVACASFIMLDDTTRNMAIDQLSQVLATFQNNDGEPNVAEPDIPTHSTESSPAIPHDYKARLPRYNI